MVIDYLSQYTSPHKLNMMNIDDGDDDEDDHEFIF